MQLLRENVEKSSLSKCIKVFNGLNIRCMIKVVKLVSYNQHFVLLRLSALYSELYTCIKLCIF